MHTSADLPVNQTLRLIEYRFFHFTWSVLGWTPHSQLRTRAVIQFIGVFLYNSPSLKTFLVREFQRKLFIESGCVDLDSE